jgi:opacity protein-like surface antigen
MHRSLLTLALLGLLVPGVANAKKKKHDPDRLVPEKGLMQLGGTGTVDISMYDGESSFGLNLNPSGGYFVTRKVEIFGNLNFSTTKGASSWALGPGVRYFIPMRPMWAYVGASVGYGSNTVTTTDPVSGDETDYSYKSFNLTPGGGILYPVAKNIAIDLGGRINYTKPTGEGMDDVKGTTTISLGYLGVQAFFK